MLKGSPAQKMCSFGDLVAPPSHRGPISHLHSERSIKPPHLDFSPVLRRGRQYRAEAIRSGYDIFRILTQAVATTCKAVTRAISWCNFARRKLHRNVWRGGRCHSSQQNDKAGESGRDGAE